VAEIAGYFGPELVWSPHLPKRTVLQDGARRGVPLNGLGSRAAKELASGFAELADRIEVPVAR
jgi:hypothetical protein